MLLEYINAAMERAVYEKFEGNVFGGSVPGCPGVSATAKTLAQCQKELRDVLDGWLIVKLRHGDNIPPIGRINLNLPRHTSAHRPLHA